MNFFGNNDEGPQEILTIELVQGRDIMDPSTAKRKEGPPPLDVVCTIKLGSQQFKSDVIRRTRTPIWKQKFDFNITKLSDSAVIVVLVESHGAMWNSFLGEIRIPISTHRSIAYSMASPHYFAIVNPKARRRDKSPGEISLKIGSASNQSKLNGPTDAVVDKTGQSAEEIYAEANVYAEDANESAHRSLDILYQTRDLGKNTRHKMQEQGNQIGRMQDDMDQIHHTMKQSERKLRSIESVWGTAANAISKNSNNTFDKKKKNDKSIKSKRKQAAKQTTKKVEDWNDTPTVGATRGRVSYTKQDAMIQRSSASRNAEGEEEQQFYAYAHDTNRTLDAMDNLLDDLKDLAVDMGTELQVQNHQLNKLNSDIARAQPRIDQATKRCVTLTK